MSSVSHLSAADWLREEFASIDSWTPVTFPKIPTHTDFSVGLSEGRSVLRIHSTQAASGLRLHDTYDVYQWPVLEWRWKVDNILPLGDVTKKRTDDAPLRIYVVFEYDPQRMSPGGRAKYRLARRLFGEYPPHASLNYIWANRIHAEERRESSYTSRSMLIFADAGPEHTGTWRTHRVNVLQDYRKAFGEDPPHRATVAIMSDTDNTDGESQALVDYIRIGD